MQYKRLPFFQSPNAMADRVGHFCNIYHRFALVPLALMVMLGLAHGQASVKKTSPKGSMLSASTVITIAGQAIKKSQIDNLVVLMAKAEAQGGEITPAQKSMLEKMVANNLIGQELLELEAKALKIGVNKSEIDSGLAAFQKNFPSPEHFKKALLESGDSEISLKEKIGRQIRSEKVMATTVEKMEPPSAKEMRAFFIQNKKEYPVNDSLRALQIVLLCDAQCKGDKAKGMESALGNLRKELIADSAEMALVIRKFMVVASREGQGPEAQASGDLGRFRPTDFNESFRKVVVKLKVGELSPVFRSPLGYHLVLLIEKFDGKYESYRMQIQQGFVSRKMAENGAALRKLLIALAKKYPVKYLDTNYKDNSEAAIYH